MGQSWMLVVDRAQGQVVAGPGDLVCQLSKCASKLRESCTHALQRICPKVPGASREWPHWYRQNVPPRSEPSFRLLRPPPSGFRSWIVQLVRLQWPHEQPTQCRGRSARPGRQLRGHHFGGPTISGFHQTQFDWFIENEPLSVWWRIQASRSNSGWTCFCWNQQENVRRLDTCNMVVWAQKECVWSRRGRLQTQKTSNRFPFVFSSESENDCAFL